MDSRKSSVKIGRQIRDYIASHHQRYGCAPGRQLVREAFAEVPATLINAHVNPLIQTGWVVKDDAVLHGAALMSRHESQIPVQGCLPRPAAQSKARFGNGSLTFNLTGIGHASPPDSFAIRVPDDQMIGANLTRGDYAIIAPVAMRNGDIVAAVIGETLVLRRYVVISNIPHLMAENSTSPDLSLAHLAVIQGVLWASLRIEPCNERLTQQKPRKVDYTKTLQARRLSKPPHQTPLANRVAALARQVVKREKGLYLKVAKSAVKFCVNEQPAGTIQKAKSPTASGKAGKPSLKPARR